MSLPIGAVGRPPPATAQPSSRIPPAGPPHAFGEVLGERATPTRPMPAARAPAAGPARPRVVEDAAPIRRVFVDLVEGERRLDRVVQAAMQGREFTVQELIGIQAMVFRHVQEMEVVSRLVDRLTGAVKTTLQTQV